MTSDYIHTLTNEEKVEFYFNKVQLIIENQPIEYKNFPGFYELPDEEPVLLECESYESANTVTTVDQILIYAIAKTVQALIFETQEDKLCLYIVSDNTILAEKYYHRLLRNKIISRLKLLTNVDPSEKKHPQVGVVILKYIGVSYPVKILFFPQKLGESIVLLSEKTEFPTQTDPH